MLQSKIYVPAYEPHKMACCCTHKVFIWADFGVVILPVDVANLMGVHMAVFDVGLVEALWMK